MHSRSVKLLLLLLVPLALYGIAKAVFYFQVKVTVDDLVLAAANHADIRYADISTDLRGAAVVHQITIQPTGQPDTISIDSVRLSSDDAMFFLRGGKWSPGEDVPPDQLGFAAQGIRLPLNAAMLEAATIEAMPEAAVAEVLPGAASGTEIADTAPAATGPCADGLRIDPALLQQLGFTELTIDIDGGYRLDEVSHSLDVMFDVELHDIESMHVSLQLDEVDIATLAAGAAPSLKLAGFQAAVRVDPAFGRQATKVCAIGTDQPVQLWAAQLAEQALAQLQANGLTLGAGLSEAVHRFYNDWGEFRIEAQPAKPVGLLSLAFMPPEQLVSLLGVRLSLNDRPIPDIDFVWQRPEGQGLASLLARPDQQAEASRQAGAAPGRTLKQRVYVDAPVSAIATHIDRQVRIQPQGQPLREGVLKRIVKGEAEIEQLLHGGRFSVFVPLRKIESLKVMTLREIQPGQD